MTRLQERERSVKVLEVLSVMKTVQMHTLWLKEQGAASRRQLTW